MPLDFSCVVLDSCLQLLFLQSIVTANTLQGIITEEKDTFRHKSDKNAEQKNKHDNKIKHPQSRTVRLLVF